MSTVGVVGGTAVAGGVAQVLAEAGHRVLLWAAEPTRAEALVVQARRMIQRRAEKGQITAEQAQQRSAALEVVPDLQALAGCSLVVESALQPVDATRATLAALERRLADDAVIALNTSSVPVSVLAAETRRPQRVVGLHFFDPAPLMRVVELIPGLRTDAALVAALQQQVQAWGHRAVVVRDAPGFVVNHIGRALLTEGLRIVHEGVTTPAVVDRIARATLNLRMGPFELLDLTGIDTTLPVTEQLYRDFQHEPRLRPTPLLALRLAAGLPGGRGRPGFAAEAGEEGTAEPWPAGEALPPVWLDRREEVRAEARQVRLHLTAVAGLRWDEGEHPSTHSLCLLMPLGQDATAAAMAAGLDPQRCVAVDAASGLAHATLMAAPGVGPRWRAAALHLFTQAGPVSWVRDSAGFVAQRLLAAMVNTACEVAQQRVASPQDIDTLVPLALGYPAGPLAWGDRFGAARVLAVLRGLGEAYGDPRDRPSPWLRRRAQLGLSLLHDG